MIFFFAPKKRSKYTRRKDEYGRKNVKGGFTNVVKSYEGDHFSEITFKGGISYILPC